FRISHARIVLSGSLPGFSFWRRIRQPRARSTVRRLLHQVLAHQPGDKRMSTPGKRVLTSAQMAGYEELGFVHSVPTLTAEEVRYYRDHVEKTWSALGGRVTRADGLHLFFPWAWDLATHPRLLDCLEDLLGPAIILRHTRIFYKYAQSVAWVGWHQDG